MLLVDEPTRALDSHTTQEILNIFTELNASGMTVLMITHEAEVAHCTRGIVLFRDGQIADPYLDRESIGHTTFAQSSDLIDRIERD